MDQELLQLNLQYLYYVSKSKLDFETWITSIFPRIVDSIKMSIKRKTETEIVQYLNHTFNETEPMSDEETLRQQLIEVEVYEVFQCAMEKLLKEQRAAEAVSKSSTTGKPSTQLSQPDLTSSNKTKDLPKGAIVKRAAKWASIEHIKLNLKKRKDVWTQRDKQATKKAFNTFMVHIRNKTGYGRQIRAPIAPMAIGLGIAGGLTATNMDNSLVYRRRPT